MDPEEKELLQQILKWTREGALPSVRERVLPFIDTDAKKRIYHAIADGTRSTRMIEEVASVSRATAVKLVEEWRAAGVVVADSEPPRAVFTMAELGIAAPELKVRGKTQTK